MGSLWAGTEDKGLAKFNGRDWKFYDKYNTFLGINDKGKFKDEGNNGLGKILMKIRNNYLLNKEYI